MISTRSVSAAMTIGIFIALAGTVAPPASAETVRAVEFYHPAFEHFFVTANPAEIAALDSGAVKGWWRTGQRYRVDDVPAAGLVPVCRFFTAAYGGKASHFFTASAEECAQVKRMPDWTYEGVAFYARLPDAQGSCGAGNAAIVRLYNSGQGGAPNHAYTADGTKQSQLVSAGWVSEGVGYCTPLAAGDPMAQTLFLKGSTWDLPVPTGSFQVPSDVRVRTQFVPITSSSTEGAISWFDYFGLAVSPTPILHISITVCGEYSCSGAAGWDPLAGAYVLIYGSIGWAMILTFEDAQGPTTPVCAMVIRDNDMGYQASWASWRSPVQQSLLSGCEAGVAYRI